MNTVRFCFEYKFKLDFIAIPSHQWVFQVINVDITCVENCIFITKECCLQ